MRNLLLAAAAVAAISSPAIARDGSPYVGVEAGVAMSDEGFFDVEVDDGVDVVEFHSGINVDYATGFDADLIAGYDFGIIRAEAELGYKKIGIENIDFSNQLGPIAGDPDDLELDDDVNITSLMGNVLLDFGGDGGFGAYVGGGIGAARVKLLDEKESNLAWQAIAGIRMALSPSIDLGLKYRYFNSGKLNFDGEFDDASVEIDGRLKTHSLLASLIYNFGAVEAAPPPPPPPPPAPPPPPPATQTCPDGSVILATEACPAPPPPPPPPPPAPERG